MLLRVAQGHVALSAWGGGQRRGPLVLLWVLCVKASLSKTLWQTGAHADVMPVDPEPAIAVGFQLRGRRAHVYRKQCRETRQNVTKCRPWGWERTSPEWADSASFHSVLQPENTQVSFEQKAKGTNLHLCPKGTCPATL